LSAADVALARPSPTVPGRQGKHFGIIGPFEDNFAVADPAIGQMCMRSTMPARLKLSTFVLRCQIKESSLQVLGLRLVKFHPKSIFVIDEVKKGAKCA